MQSIYTDTAIQRLIDRENFQAYLDKQTAKPAGQSISKLSKFVRILPDLQTMPERNSQ